MASPSGIVLGPLGLLQRQGCSLELQGSRRFQVQGGFKFKELSFRFKEVSSSRRFQIQGGFIQVQGAFKFKEFARSRRFQVQGGFEWTC